MWTKTNNRETTNVANSIQPGSSRRQFLSTSATTAVAGIMLPPGLDWAADLIDPRVAGIVAASIGIDTHNHIDVPLTGAEMPGPDIDLSGEMKRSGLSAICMTFATDYQPGDAYDRFLKGLASMDRQLDRNGMQRSLTLADIRTAHKNRQPTVIQAVEGGHFLQGHIERLEEAYKRPCVRQLRADCRPLGEAGLEEPPAFPFHGEIVIFMTRPSISAFRQRTHLLLLD